jgi:hypothetical protein
MFAHVVVTVVASPASVSVNVCVWSDARTTVTVDGGVDCPIVRVTVCALSNDVAVCVAVVMTIGQDSPEGPTVRVHTPVVPADESATERRGLELGFKEMEVAEGVGLGVADVEVGVPPNHGLT